VSEKPEEQAQTEPIPAAGPEPAPAAEEDGRKAAEDQAAAERAALEARAVAAEERAAALERMLRPKSEPEPDRRAERRERLRDYAKRDDAAAEAVLDLEEELDDMRETLRARAALDEIEDRKIRAEVRDHYVKENRRGRSLDMKAARAEVEKEHEARARRKLADENEDLRKALAAAGKQPPRDVIPTHLRDEGGGSGKERVLSRADWQRQQSEASDEERILAQIARRRGAIKVK